MFIGYRSKFVKEIAFFNNFTMAIKEVEWWEGDKSDKGLMRHSYASHILPGNLNADTRPQNYLDFLLLEMQDAEMHDHLNDMRQLMNKFPDKRDFLLRLCDNAGAQSGRTLSDLYPHFFNDNNCDDSSMDEGRMRYLTVAMRHHRQLPGFVRQSLKNYLPALIEREPTAEKFTFLLHGAKPVSALRLS